jgi:hypothetical protein
MSLRRTRRASSAPSLRISSSATEVGGGEVRLRFGERLPLAGVFGVYLLASIVVVGRYAVVHMSSVCACSGSADSASYMWAMAWWPHALLHGLNPFHTRVLWAPSGANVAQAAMMPAAAIAMAPVTELFGPIASYNVVAIVSPALSGLTAYLLCRHLTRRELPALVGGYAFGFSSFELVRLVGHLDLTATFALPLIVLVATKRVQGGITARRHVASMTALFLVQAGLSTELLADAVGLGLLLVLCARAAAPAQDRGQIDRMLAETALAGLFALVIGAPLFYYAVTHGAGAAPQYFADTLGLDLLNPILPTASTALGGHAFASLTNQFSGGFVLEADGYLGLPMIGVFVLFAWSRWRSGLTARLATIGAAVSFVLALGPHLYVAGHTTHVPLPFALVGSLPVLDNLEPSRLAVFVTLAIAVGAAGLCAIVGESSRSAQMLLLLALVLPFPDAIARLYGTPIRDPALFTSQAFRREIHAGESILALPFGFNDTSMLWQAETGFWFRMPEGYLRFAIPTPFDRERTVRTFLYNRTPTAAALRAFMRRHGVTAVVVDPLRRGKELAGVDQTTDWVTYLRRLGFHGRAVGGVDVFRAPVH